MMSKRFFSVVLVSLLVAGFCQPDCVAQSREPVKGQKSTYKRDTAEYAQIPVESAPGLPNLPDFSRKTSFMTGEFFPSIKGGPVYILHYACKESSVQFLSTYRESLLQHGWTIDTASTSPTTLSASDATGNIVRISTSNLQKAAETELIVFFKIRRRRSVT